MRHAEMKRACVVRKGLSSKLAVLCLFLVLGCQSTDVLAQTYNGLYSYDAAGNLQVIEVESAPTITSITPTIARQSTDATFTIQGGNLGFVTVASSNSGIIPTIQSTTGTTLLIGLAISPTVPLGPQTITVTNSLGSASIPITIYVKQPVLSLQPIPFTVEADGKAHAGTLTLSSADGLSDTFTLASSAPALVSISPSTVTIAAGQTTAAVSITPATTAAGTVYLQATSPTFLTDDMPILIGASADGSATAYTPAVGVVNPLPVASSTSFKTVITSPAVGVSAGPLVTDIFPNILYGGGDSTVVFHGFGLLSTMTTSLTTPAGVNAVALSLGGTTPVTPDSISASADGTSLTLTIHSGPPGNVIAPTVQPKPYVPIHLITAAGQPVPFLPPNGGTLLTGLLPEVSSMNPIVGTAGTVQTIYFYGINLQNGFGVAFKVNSDGTLPTTPTGDIIFANVGSVNSTGTVLGTQMQILPTAGGTYVLEIVTPFGVSTILQTPSVILSGGSPGPGVTESLAPTAPTTTAAPANQYTVVHTVVGATNLISSPPVGVVVGTPPSTNESIGPIASRLVSVLHGSGVASMTPQKGIIGTTVPVTVAGASLSGVTSITVSPSTGVTVSEPTVTGGGTGLTFNMTIAASAPETPRRVDVYAGTTKLPFLFAGGNEFLITPPPPAVSEVTPDFLIKGSTPTQLTIVGTNFQNASVISFLPGTGISAAAPSSISSDGTQIVVTVSAASSTPSGAQALTVTTPGGTSSSTATPANIVTIGSSTGASYGPIASPKVGIVVGTPPVATESIGPVFTRLVSVVNPPAAKPTSTTQTVFGFPVGTLNGSVASGLSPQGWQKSSAATLTVTGNGLNSVTGLSIVPSSGITVSALTPNANGKSLTAVVNIPSTTLSGTYRIGLTGASGKIPFTSLANSEIQVAGLPSISSITPIVVVPGQQYTLTVRGTGLADATAVIATPSAGIEFSDTVVYSTDAVGPMLTVQFSVDANATLGNRAIQLVVAGGSTSSTATSANTLSITATQ